MSTIPELKQKKILRDTEFLSAKELAISSAEIEAQELIKTITAKAQAYEEEYIQVI
jgi:hypothetical protein